MDRTQFAIYFVLLLTFPSHTIILFNITKTKNTFSYALFLFIYFKIYYRFFAALIKNHYCHIKIETNKKQKVRERDRERREMVIRVSADKNVKWNAYECWNLCACVKVRANIFFAFVEVHPNKFQHIWTYLCQNPAAKVSKYKGSQWPNWRKRAERFIEHVPALMGNSKMVYILCSYVITQISMQIKKILLIVTKNHLNP